MRSDNLLLSQGSWMIFLIICRNSINKTTTVIDADLFQIMGSDLTRNTMIRNNNVNHTCTKSVLIRWIRIIVHGCF